jgi:hypothetical protein
MGLGETTILEHRASDSPDFAQWFIDLSSMMRAMHHLAA